MPQVLGALPTPIRDELIEELNKIERNYRERRWEPAELDAGRLCEIVYSIMRGHVDGAIPSHAHKPKDMVAACRQLEGVSSAQWSRSIRILIPRVLLGVYEVRNNRDVGHVGGEVPSNEMDATLVVATSKWLVAELVRIFHQVDPSTATEFVDALIQRHAPGVWEVAGVRRVLNPSLSMRDRTLLLLHASPRALRDDELCAWAEHSNPSVFRSVVLGTLHVDRLIEYDRISHLVHLSPTGVRYVESRLPEWLA